MHIVAVFEDAGCCAIDASSADEALEKLEKYPTVSAIVTDIRMPGKIDGLGLAHCVKAKRPSAVVVICSGNRLPRKEELPKDVRFVAKPVQLELLTDLANEICKPS